MKIEFKNNIQNNNTNKEKTKTPNFKGPLDGPITQTLMTIDTNQMVNSTLVDLVSMVIPRTYIDTKKRNKFAGFETFFREITGTIIMCLSSGVASLGIANVYNKVKDKKTYISPNMWATNDTFDIMKHSWMKSENNVDNYVHNIFSNLSGLNGRETSAWKDIPWEKIEWIDNPAWKNIKWKNPKWQKVIDQSKNQEHIIKTLSDLITDKNIDRHDAKKVFSILEYRIANALKVSNNINVKIDDKSLSATLKNLIRDTYDLGKNIFTNDKINLKNAEIKLKSMNKVKTLGAIAIVATIGLVNQYINRQITKKRTGKDNFVGQQNFEKTQQSPKSIEKQLPTENKKNKLELVALKALASLGIFALSMKVMKIKSPSDFIKKLEFTGPITSGNAIKTLYTATLIGRFLAARDKDELRESATRDYLGFLNWLVLGGFVSKGVAQLFFDPKQNNLFNIKEDGSKGIKRWLNNVSEKSHAEIAAQGAEFAKKHIWQKNIAQFSGLLYSSLALGFALPLLNILITKNKANKKTKTEQANTTNFIENQTKPVPLPQIFTRFNYLEKS